MMNGEKGSERIMSQAWMIASGKGGVGKSTISAALAVGLAKRGEKVVVIDIDIGLRNQDVILGMENRIVFDLIDVVNKDCKLNQALVYHSAYPSLALLPAAQFSRMKAIEAKDIAKLVRKLKETFTYVIIDCPAGVERGFLNALGTADDSILVTTPDDVAMRDVERVCTIIEEKGLPRPMLIVNQVIPELLTSGEMYTPDTVAQTLDLSLLGVIPQDKQVYRNLLKHQTCMDDDCPAQKAFDRIVDRLLGAMTPISDYQERESTSLWQKLFQKRKRQVTY